MRKSEGLPIYVSWTKGVRDWEAGSIVAGMRAGNLISLPTPTLTERKISFSKV